MARAQTATWQQELAFAQAVAGQSEAYAMASNAAGAVYIAGSFSCTLTLGTTTLSSAYAQAWPRNPTTGKTELSAHYPIQRTILLLNKSKHS
ncbi:hypothetical protein GCM10023172_23350 [Hymenobacter ginsengisoli]|uniref:Uncharacterized protein n=1 Tax=Hymenobacter ginsengisoli TaxID=1051626 RepID=A0ABP8QI47_9BACT